MTALLEVASRSSTAVLECVVEIVASIPEKALWLGREVRLLGKSFAVLISRTAKRVFANLPAIATMYLFPPHIRFFISFAMLYVTALAEAVGMEHEAWKIFRPMVFTTMLDVMYLAAHALSLNEPSVAAILAGTSLFYICAAAEYGEPLAREPR